jgi:hypothetical protein
MTLPDGKMYSCPGRCSEPGWAYHFYFSPFRLIGVLYVVIKFTRLIPAIRGNAHWHANSAPTARSLVTNHTFMDLPQEFITCVG